MRIAKPNGIITFLGHPPIGMTSLKNIPTENEPKLKKQHNEPDFINGRYIPPCKDGHKYIDIFI